MEIQQLRHLIAAVEHHNMLKAADNSYISQSGLSRSIKSLEHRLGVKLLVRGPKGVEPTVYGLSVIRRAKVILNEVRRALEEVKAIEQARIGEVKFGITQNYADYVVPEIISKLHSERPDLRVTVVADGFLELLEKVKTETIDFAFGLIAQIHQSEGIIIEPLRGHKSCVIVGKHHELAQKNAVTVDDLGKGQWAMLSSEGVQRGFSLFFETRGMALPAQILKTNSIDLIRRVVTETNAITILPQEAVQKDIETGHLAVLNCETPVERTKVGLFYREGGLLTPQAELVIDRFRKAAYSERLDDALSL